VTDTLINNTPLVQDQEIDIADSVGTTDSLELDVKAGAKILDVVDFSITAKYAHQWTSEHTFTKKKPLHCSPYYKCWIQGVAPMLRDTGNFTVKLGNTTWNIRVLRRPGPQRKRHL